MHNCFCVFQAGNDFGDEFDELMYVMAQVMIIKLKVEEPKIIFDPLFKEIRDIILRCFSEIIASGDGLTRVSFFSLCQSLSLSCSLIQQRALLLYSWVLNGNRSKDVIYP